MEGKEKNSKDNEDPSGKSFGKICSKVAKKQRTKFYILRRCIAMPVCWHERS